MSDISIVVIGKNESKNLTNLYKSLQGIKLKSYIVYCDSHSSDNSVEISLKYADVVIELENSHKLCAAAGRAVGTMYAKNEWVLYLDGDMELESEFVEFLNERKYLNFSENICGFVGYYTYVYKDLSESKNVLLQRSDEVVRHFGGAVFLKKSAVLKSHNWNASVVANEEIDLHAKLIKNGYRVFGLDKKMVRHQAKKVSNLQTLKELFVPINKKYYGFGQMLFSQIKYKSFLSFLRLKPYPFLLFLFIILSFKFSIFYAFILGLFLYVSFKQKWYYNIIYISDIIRAVVGIFTYKNYEPKILKITKGQK